MTFRESVIPNGNNGREMKDCRFSAPSTRRTLCTPVDIGRVAGSPLSEFRTWRTFDDFKIVKMLLLQQGLRLRASGSDRPSEARVPRSSLSSLVTVFLSPYV
jgi:hypothetical protein